MNIEFKAQSYLQVKRIIKLEHKVDEITGRDNTWCMAKKMKTSVKEIVKQKNLIDPFPLLQSEKHVGMKPPMGTRVSTKDQQVYERLTLIHQHSDYHCHHCFLMKHSRRKLEI